MDWVRLTPLSIYRSSNQCYHSLYAPPKIMSPAFWSLIQGWITVFAWIAK